MAECHVLASGNAQLAKLVVKRSPVRLEKLPPALAQGPAASVPQRRTEVERHHFRGKDRHDAVDVFGANRIHEAAYHFPDVRFRFRSIGFACHKRELQALAGAGCSRVVASNASASATKVIAA